MQNMLGKLILIFVVLALCLAAIFGKQLQLGKDLRGGVSFVYKVDVADDAQNPKEILTQTITVLKDRVNPQGIYDISMEPNGRDRIVISMPLADAKVQELRATYEDKLGDLVALTAVDRAEVDAALRRGDVVATIAGGDAATELGTLAATLQEAYSARASAREALANAPADISPADERVLQSAVAVAEIDFDDASSALLSRSEDETSIKRVLSLPTELELDEIVEGEEDQPSRREIAITDFKANHPNAAALLDETVAAYDEYQDNLTGFDDPEDLKRLLRGAGVLDFRIAIDSANPEGVDVEDMRRQLEEVGPLNTVSPTSRWYKINQIKQWYDDDMGRLALEADPAGYFANRRGMVAQEYEDDYYLLLYTTAQRSLTHDGGQKWSLTGAGRTTDQLGRPAVRFELDATGANRMGRLTGGNVGEAMAIVLDGEVFSAPNINSQITSSGIIEGEFSLDELSYLERVLAAGSLSAKLSPNPISTSILGPSIGADNLSRGREAFIIALIAVAVFMLAYYFFAGIVAVTALAVNGIIIFGVLMGIDATFTLPGLAGIVLTVGMAVDANVLIYERIREELVEGELDLRGCVRQGYAKALSTILDGNVTNLIVCFVLFYTATTEVKGFALTLTIGICATLFTALFLTRQIFYFYTDFFKMTKLSMLPTAVPAIHRALEPNINWVSKRPFFWVCSLVAVVTSIVLVSSRGAEMLDTEFRGGVSIKLATATVDADGDGQPDTDESGELVRMQMRHTGEGGMEERIRSIAERAADEPDEATAAIYEQFGKAQVLTVGEVSTDESGAVVGSEFQVKISSPQGSKDETTIQATVQRAIEAELGSELDVVPPLVFSGLGATDVRQYVFPVTSEELSRSIKRADATMRMPEFLGGVAIVLEDVTPAVTVDELRRRIVRMRNQPGYENLSGRDFDVVSLTPVDPNDPRGPVRDAVLLVKDEYRSFMNIDPQVWYGEVADPEWELVTQALSQPASLDEVNSYSSAVAQTLKANATVAVILTLLGILIYIWVRFGSLRYSIAAIAALVHDVTISLGLLAISGIIGGTVLGHAILVEPFRIDLGVVAALLTIIGYSLNDTIVILDRIRENRGKLPVPNAKIVNRSINQTISRTVLTSFTTLIAVLIMYAEGGSGIRPFTFCLLTGLVVGTYSSIAIAAPLVVSNDGSNDRPSDRPDRPGGDSLMKTP